MRTRIEVALPVRGATPTDTAGLAPRSPRVDLTHGLIQARRVRSALGTVKIALVAGQALLLAGDEVRIDVRVAGPVAVEIIEPAGTVAFDMRADPAGRGARWDIELRASDGARLFWRGQPFVVAGGSRVERDTTVSVDATAQVVWRETVVLGRTGETGGDLRTTTRVQHAGRPLLVEALNLSTAARGGPGVLGTHRCLDTVTSAGVRLNAAAMGPPGGGAHLLQLDGEGSIARWIGDDLHRSPLGQDAAVRSSASMTMMPLGPRTYVDL